MERCRHTWRAMSLVVDVEDRACPCCGHALHTIGELRTEQLDMVPSQLRVRVTRRPRYACHSCEGTVVVAPAPTARSMAACRTRRWSRTCW